MVNGQIGRLRTGIWMERKVVFVPKFCLQNIKPGKMLQFLCMGEINVLRLSVGPKLRLS